MINPQDSKSTLEALPEPGAKLSSGQVMALGGSGQVRVLAGRVWLTSPGDPSDHVLDAGESYCVSRAGPTLVEAWDRDAPAFVAWRPHTLFERLRRGIAGTWGRCWELMNPAGRVGMGTAAALAAMLASALLFGPLSQARVRSLIGAGADVTVLHNAGAARAAALETRGRRADDRDTGKRPSGAAPQARRRTPGLA